MQNFFPLENVSFSIKIHVSKTVEFAPQFELLLLFAAYLKHGDYNIIVIDWSKISIKGYIWASNRVKRVGEFVSRMIDFLSNHQMELSETIVVGHSLGAHVAGIAARNAKGEVKSVIGKFLSARHI